MSSSADVTISTDQLTTIENALVQLREAIDPATVPEPLMKALLDAEQLCSGLLDKVTPGGGGGGKGPYPSMANQGGPK